MTVRHLIIWPPAADKDEVSVTPRGLQWRQGQNVCNSLVKVVNVQDV